MTAIPELPPGSIENASICIIQYLDDTANMKYAIATEGDVPLSTMLGLLEMSKDRIKECYQ